MPSVRDRECETLNDLVHLELHDGEAWLVIQVGSGDYLRSNEQEKGEGEGRRWRNLESESGSGRKKRGKRKDQWNPDEPWEEREL